MTPKKTEEIKTLDRQFRLECADFLLPESYNQLADRLRELVDEWH